MLIYRTWDVYTSTAPGVCARFTREARWPRVGFFCVSKNWYFSDSRRSTESKTKVRHPGIAWTIYFLELSYCFNSHPVRSHRPKFIAWKEILSFPIPIRVRESSYRLWQFLAHKRAWLACSIGKVESLCAGVDADPIEALVTKLCTPLFWSPNKIFRVG